MGWALLLTRRFYLSIFHVAQLFLSFQWDTLLLETGLLSIFLVSWQGHKNGPESPPSWFVLFLFRFRFLLLRSAFSSGLVKLLNQDPTWRYLTALYYHYATQPLPDLVRVVCTPIAPRTPGVFSSFSFYHSTRGSIFDFWSPAHNPIWVLLCRFFLMWWLAWTAIKVSLTCWPLTYVFFCWMNRCFKGGWLLKRRKVKPWFLF